MLAVPGDFSQEVISTKYVDALCEGIEEHDAECGPGESIRLRLALHAGERPAEEDELAGPGVVTASSLADSAVLRRVLAAAKGSALALVVSDEWYSAVVKEGNAPAEGYQEVWIEAKRFADWAWVRVPGRTQPPGLLPGDRRPRPGSGGPGTSSASQQAAGAGASISNYGTIGAFGDFRGATIDGNVSFGNNYHGTHGPGHNGGPQQDGGPR